MFSIPVDLSRKSGGLATIAHALNAGEVARAQIATLNLQIPDPPPSSTIAPARDELVKLISSLDASGLIKADWNPDEHPRWPAGAPDSQGGEFAPKGEGELISQSDDHQTYPIDLSSRTEHERTEQLDVESDSPSVTPAVFHGGEEAQLEDAAYRGDFYDEMVRKYATYLRAAGFRVETEVRVWMADGSAHTRIDVLAQALGETYGVEVKTGKRPFPTFSQLLIYPHMIYGESVLSDDLKITTFGFKPWQILPKIPVLVMYVRDPDTEPVFSRFDPKKMLEEYYRRIRRIRGFKKVLAALAKAFSIIRGKSKDG